MAAPPRSLGRSRPHPLPLPLLALVAALLLAAAGPSAPAAAASPASPAPVRYEPPVEAPVVDGFRAPATRFGPGNRGLEYGTVPGALVRAAAPGAVVFAGVVAGSRHVTILHADGVRTSYSFLEAIDVRVGEQVLSGQPVGLAGSRTFFSARLRDAYLDPAALLAADERATVRLVPDLATTPRQVRRVEPREVLWLAAAESADDPGRLRRAIAWARGRASDATGAVVDLASDATAATAATATSAAGAGARGVAQAWSVAAAAVDTPNLVVDAWRRVAATGSRPLGAWVAAMAEIQGVVGRVLPRSARLAGLSPVVALAGHGVRGARRLREAWWQRAECTPAAVSPPPLTERRVLVLVGGLGSSSEVAAIDGLPAGDLGYASGDVIRFSYRGGRIPDPTDVVAGLPAQAYEPADTLVNIRQSGARLADLLVAVRAGAPGVPVDVVAHSQGGLVARVALADIARRGAGAAAGLPATLVTLGSPHDGADLATAVARVRSTLVGSALLEGVHRAGVSPLDPSSPAIRQLAPGSSLLAELSATALPPDGVELVAVGARADLVVAAGRAAFEGARRVVVSVPGWNDHANLPSAPTARREVALAVARLPPTCESGFDALVDVGVSEVISAAEGLLGVLVSGVLGSSLGAEGRRAGTPPD